MTTYYHAVTGTYATKGDPFTLDGTQYPANWLDLTTDDEKLVAGLVPVVDVGTRADDRTHIVSEEVVGAERRITSAPRPIEQIFAMVESDYTARLEQHYDAVARQRRYDNRITCALRAGYAGPFQSEGQAFAQWMDACNAQGYEIMAEVAAGERELPTFEDVMAELPAMVWPA